MSDLPNQVSDFQKKWMDQQQKWMNDWLETLQSMGGGAPNDTWQQTLDVMEQQVKSALDAQRKSLVTLAENAQHTEGSPESIKQWTQKMEEGMVQWNDMQQQLWSTWFNTLRSSSPGKAQPEDILANNWRDFANRAVEIQEQWLSAWEGMQPAAAKPAGKKATKKKK